MGVNVRQEQKLSCGGCEQMPKININGITREMIPEEIAEMERLAAEMPVPEMTAEERLAALEEKLDILDIILGGG